MINPRPQTTKSAWNSQKNSDYVALYRAATTEARRIDNTAADLEENNPGAVRFSEDSKFPGAEVYGLDTNSPHVDLYSETVSSKPKSDDSDALITMKNSRRITIHEFLGGEALEVSDVLRQEVASETEGANGTNRDSLSFTEMEKSPLVETSTGQTITEDSAEIGLMAQTGWSIADFKQYKNETNG